MEVMKDLHHNNLFRLGMVARKKAKASAATAVASKLKSRALSWANAQRWLLAAFSSGINDVKTQCCGCCRRSVVVSLKTKRRISRKVPT